jgi:NHLM bacteriocin system ABC transporter ATP-binding protein
MNARAYAPVLDAEGTPRHVAGDQPFLLESGRVGYVQSGRLDIFAVRPQNGEPVGRRTHLFRLSAGDPLIGTGLDSHLACGLLAVGNPGTVIVEVPQRYLEAILARAGAAQCADDFFRAWVDHLCRALSNNRSPRNGNFLPPNETITLEPGACVRPGVPFGWVQQCRGSSRFMNRTGCDLGEGDILPITPSAWLQAHDESDLLLHSTDDLLATAIATGEDRIWPALARLNRMAAAIIDQQLDEAAAAHRERGRLKQLATGASLSSALNRLAAPMLRQNDRRQVIQNPQSGIDDMTAALHIVANAMGVRVDGAVGAVPERSDRLAALTQSLRLRSRRVVLRDAWWTTDCSPLLGRLTEPARYVALLPGKRGGYRLIDPMAATGQMVNATVAATLEPFALTFYRPFPESRLGLLSLVRFGMSGLREDVLTVAGVALLAGLLGMLAPMAIALLYGSVIPSADRGQLFQLTAILFLSGVISAVFGVVRGLALLRIQTKGGARLQSAMWDRLIALPLRFFRDYSSGDLAMRAMNVDAIRQTLSVAVLSPLLNGLFSVFNLALLVYYDAALAFAAVGMLLIALSLSAGISYLQLRGRREILTVQSKTAGLVMQLLTGINKLKMVGGEARAFSLWANLFARQRQEQFRSRVLGNWLSVFYAGYPVLCTLIIFALKSGYRPDLDTGSFLGFVAAFNLCLSAVISTGTAIVSMLTVVPLYEQVKPILLAQPEVASATHEAGELTGNIELQHISFRYRTDSPLVIRNVSVRIDSGEFVAFVGPSGSGKSTLLRLLLGFEAPEEGSIYFDEQELSGLDVRTVRQQIGTVLQSGRVMPGDIFTNIAGSSLATLDDAWAAARAAGFEEDIKSMPMGMHTMVDETGSTLSGGQRQRLLIARALVNKPRLLLFDEATSALDNRTQEIVSRSLDQLQATRIVIAHRLSTIQHADRICVLSGGELVESGSYHQLMAQEGLFYRMAQRQIA